jgi:putative acetyltransferase
MVTYKRTNSKDPDFMKLAEELEADLKIRDGEQHETYAQLNKISLLKYAIVAYDHERPVGCGALREYNDDSMEVKRMFVAADKRNLGIATEILRLLERLAMNLKCKKCLLETGINQPEAIQFYLKNGYRNIPKYGQYENSGNSVCFEKILFNE